MIKKDKIKHNCIVCNKIYYTIPSRVNSICCSKECKFKYQHIIRDKNRNKKICSFCNKTFYVIKSRKKAKYCSKKCYTNSIRPKLSNETKKKISVASMGKKNHFYGKTHTEEAKKKINLFKKGMIPWNKGTAKNPNDSKYIRISLKYKKWRMDICKRDNFCCQICEKVGGRLEVHHIKSFVDYPKLRFKINNGITLCRKCHMLIHGYKIRRND